MFPAPLPSQHSHAVLTHFHADFRGYSQKFFVSHGFSILNHSSPVLGEVGRSPGGVMKQLKIIKFPRVNFSSLHFFLLSLEPLTPPYSHKKEVCIKVIPTPMHTP